MPPFDKVNLLDDLLPEYYEMDILGMLYPLHEFTNDVPIECYCKYMLTQAGCKFIKNEEEQLKLTREWAKRKGGI